MKDTGPSNQSAKSVEAKSPDEYGSVSIVAKNPVRMTERCKGICAEICSLKTRRPRSSDVQRVLKMFVQRIEEAIRKALCSLAESNIIFWSTHP